MNPDTPELKQQLRQIAEKYDLLFGDGANRDAEGNLQCDCEGCRTGTALTEAYEAGRAEGRREENLECQMEAGGWTGDVNTPKNAHIVTKVCQGIKRSIRARLSPSNEEKRNEQ